MTEQNNSLDKTIDRIERLTEIIEKRGAATVLIATGIILVGIGIYLKFIRSTEVSDNILVISGLIASITGTWLRTYFPLRASRIEIERLKILSHERIKLKELEDNRHFNDINVEIEKQRIYSKERNFYNENSDKGFKP